MIAIEMIGGIYCPLSLRDPEHRRSSLTEQVSSKLVLVHHGTKPKLNGTTSLFDIETFLIDNIQKSNFDLDTISSISMTTDNIAYIIFTSGSTGMPKIVS